MSLSAHRMIAAVQGNPTHGNPTHGNPPTVNEHATGVNKGMSREPTGHSIRTHLTDCRIAYGARALWQRSFRSSLRWGKPITWRREAGGSD
jgi:hypothetical protein